MGGLERAARHSPRSGASGGAVSRPPSPRTPRERGQCGSVVGEWGVASPERERHSRLRPLHPLSHRPTQHSAPRVYGRGRSHLWVVHGYASTPPLRERG